MADFAVRARQDPVAYGLLPLNLLLPSLDGTPALERLAARLAAEALPTDSGECECAARAIGVRCLEGARRGPQSAQTLIKRRAKGGAAKTRRAGRRRPPPPPTHTLPFSQKRRPAKNKRQT